MHTNVPDRICMECAYNLRLFHKFRRKCESAQARIIELISHPENTDDSADCKSMVTERDAIVIEDSDPIYIEENDIKYIPPAENTIDADDELIDCSPVVCNANETEDETTRNTTDVLQLPINADEETSIDVPDNAAGDQSEIVDNVNVSGADDEDEAIVEYLLDELEQSTVHEDEPYTGDELDDQVQLMDQDDDYDDAASRHEARTISPAVDTVVKPTHQPPASTYQHYQPRSFPCEQCGRLFGRKFTLDQHRRTHTGAKDYECSLCRARFTRSSHLDAHLRIHRNVRPHVCDECGRSFTKSSDLLRHRRIHSDRRDFQCAECAKRFKRPRDLQVHQLSHNGVRPNVCGWPGCGKAYTSHSSLKKHRLRWHPDTVTASGVGVQASDVSVVVVGE